MSTQACAACGARYDYALASCTLCGGALAETEAADAEVLAVTEITVPSLGHEEVPYWCALVRKPDGGQAIVKTERPVAVGDTIAARGSVAEVVHTVGIVGSGVMARGLTELMLNQGHRVVWVGRSLERLEAARAKVADRLGRVMDEDELTDAVSRISLAQDMGALAACDIVIEAVVEELEPKRAVLERIEAVVSPETLIATNTSSLPLDELSAGMRHPERFGGLHFFNPPTRMRLVETVRGPRTNEQTAALMSQFARLLGKVPVPVAAGPGFVVNRVLMPLLNEAVRTLEDGIAPAEDIDEAVRLGLNHPMGPLALADLIGLDVVVKIMDDLHGRLGDEAYAPRPMLRQLVAEGKLGRKTGEGFYEYVPPPVSG